MRWIWIDRFVSFESGKSATAVKNLSLAEDHFADHMPGYPVMPAPLILEGLAQTGGILVGVRARDVDDYDAPSGVVANSAWRDQGVRVRWEHVDGEGLWSIGWQSDFARALGRPRSDSNR